MKRSLVVVLSLAILASFSAQGQSTSAPPASDTIEIKHPTHLDAADRAQLAQGVKQVNRGMQGFFQALNDALAQVHRERQAAAHADLAKSASSDEANASGNSSTASP